MTYNEALEYIQQIAALGSRPGLERITELLEKLGNPQNRLKFIHIAGTNGKGSCSAMASSVFKTCGYRTGLFTSPHLVKYNERFQINGKDISDDAFAALIESMRPAADSMEDHPTEFELLTAAAFKYFADERCDIVVLETGMGGRLDSTNVIPAPLAAVIMNIGLDHTEYLGNTLEEIATEKAAIIKPGSLCVLYDQPENVKQVVRERCEEVSAEFVCADFSEIMQEFDSIEGQVFIYKGTPYAIPLLGAHQQKNAAVVIELADALRRHGMEMEPNDVEFGLYATSWPARFEVVSDSPYFIIDGGHNPQCAETVASALEAYFPFSRRVILLGLLADKDRTGIEDILAPVADEFICVTPDSHRALPAEELAKEVARYGKPVRACESIREGVAEALEAAGEDGMVCCVGSLYMAGEVRSCFVPEIRSDIPEIPAPADNEEDED